MRRSSKIILIVCSVLLVYLIALVVSVRSASLPDLTPADASAMMTRLAHAFDASSTEGVLSFAAPDATVAGHKLDEIRTLLHNAFGAMKNPHVEFRDLQYERRNASTVYLSFTATVVDQGPDAYGGGGPLYQQHMGFVVQRMEMPRLGGLLTSYDWKIADVDAPNLPIQ